MKRNKYSAGAVKFALWFMEFRKAVWLLEQGKSFDEIKELGSGFYPLFLDSDVATQKLYALTGS